MCRLVVYSGHGRPLLLASLLTRPTHSIIKQSLHCLERALGAVNGDGFGVGWYDERGPCVFTGTSPAWNNCNLARLAEHVQSDILLAHVRAASAGLATTEANCHPFAYAQFLFMHNGDVRALPRIKRRALQLLPDHLFGLLGGHTDSCVGGVANGSALLTASRVQASFVFCCSWRSSRRRPGRP